MSATVLYDIQRILERTGGAHPAIPDPLFSLADTVLYRIRDLLLQGAGSGGAPAPHEASHQSGGTDALTGLVDANARLQIAKDGTVIGTRRELNFLTGSGTTLTVTDDSGNEKVDVTITSTGSGSTSGSQTEIDFGTSLHHSEASFTITDATVSPTSIIVATLAGDAPTGKDADETEMDPLTFTTTAGTGSFTLRVSALSGSVHDKFKVDYIVV